MTGSLFFLCFRMLLKSASLILLVSLLIKSTAARIGEFDAMHFDLFVSSAFLMLSFCMAPGAQRCSSLCNRRAVSAQVLILEQVHELSQENGICSQLNANCVCGKTLEWKDLAFQRATLLPRLFTDGKVRLCFLMKMISAGLIKDLNRVYI
jgi:hypothetical protein